MSTLKALREQRAVAVKDLRELMDKNPSDKWNADLTAKYDEGMKQIDDLDAQIGRIEKLNALAAETMTADTVREEGARKAHNQKKPELAVFAKWLAGGDNALNEADRAVIRNTMSTTTGSEGGYTVPTEVAKTISDALKAFGGVREVATILSTGGFGDFNFPTSDGTSETGELIGQNTTATSADPAFGVVTISPYKFSSKVVAVPFELLQDTTVDMEAFVAGRLATRLARIQNTYFTTGTGTSQPRGVVTAAASGKVGITGQTASVIFDDLVDLIHSVDPAYRQLNRCRFMMNDASLKVIRKLKDSQGRPIFLPGYEGLGAKMADSLLGYDVSINQDVATMAANAKSILFGDFSFYVIREDMNMQLFRFTDSAYTKLGQVGFLAWARAGGNFTDVGVALKYYQNSAT